MERLAVKSSALAALGYDPATLTMEVAFHGKDDAPGRVWRYSPVDPGVYGAMLLPGASIGSIFHREVKANPAVSGVDVTDELAVR